jgi:hypothetical protein
MGPSSRRSEPGCASNPGTDDRRGEGSFPGLRRDDAGGDLGSGIGYRALPIVHSRLRAGGPRRSSGSGGEEAIGVGGELVAAVGGAEPPGVPVVVGGGVAGGFDGHAADGVGYHAGEFAEGAVFEP